MAKLRRARREIAIGRRGFAPVLATNNRAIFGMTLTARIDHFPDGALAPDESRFEKPEIGPVRGTDVCAHFGRRLQKIFPLPPQISEPENVGILLRKIEAKLD